jgi:hypothetical protein
MTPELNQPRLLLVQCQTVFPEPFLVRQSAPFPGPPSAGSTGWGESPRRISPRGARRTVRELLDSYRSHHITTPHPHLEVAPAHEFVPASPKTRMNCRCPVIAKPLLSRCSSAEKLKAPVSLVGSSGWHDHADLSASGQGDVAREARAYLFCALRHSAKSQCPSTRPV